MTPLWLYNQAGEIPAEAVMAVYETVFKTDAVAAATAEFKQSRITALIDTNRTDRAAIEAALKKRDITVKKPAP